MFSFLIDLLFPPSIKERRVRERAQNLGKHLIPRRHEVHKFISAAASYDDSLIRDIVLLAKFHSSTYAAELMGAAIADVLLNQVADTRVFSNRMPLIIPVPLGVKRLNDRGYNQAARITEAALKLLPEGVVDNAPRNILARKETLPQTKLSKSERAKNMRGAFSVTKPEAVKDRDIILIDDVVTTGATLVDAKRALQSAGARAVSAIVFARAE